MLLKNHCVASDTEDTKIPVLSTQRDNDNSRPQLLPLAPWQYIEILDQTLMKVRMFHITNTLARQVNAKNDPSGSKERLIPVCSLRSSSPAWSSLRVRQSTMPLV